MSFDIADWTVKVLEEGLPPPVDSVDPGNTIPVARWIKDGYGAVLFVRKWRNGQWDSDCAATAADSNGKWLHPGSYGGNGWLNLLERPDEGWNGKPVVWLTYGGGPSPIDDKYIRTVDGMAARSVSAVELRRKTGELYQVLEVDSPYGAFVMGFTDDDTYLGTPLDRHGRPFREENGEIIREVIKAG